MKKVLLAVVLLIGRLTISCETGNEGKIEASGHSGKGLDGTWKIVKAEGTMSDINIGNLYIFNGKKVTLKGSGMTTPGTYTIKKDTLVFQMAENAEFGYLHEMKGKQLIIRPIGSDLVLYLDRQVE